MMSRWAISITSSASTATAVLKLHPHPGGHVHGRRHSWNGIYKCDVGGSHIRWRCHAGHVERRSRNRETGEQGGPQSDQQQHRALTEHLRERQRFLCKNK